MSQLNNDEDKVDLEEDNVVQDKEQEEVENKKVKEKKHVSNVVITILLLLFVIIAAGTTYGLIYFKNKEKQQVNVNIVTVKENKKDESAFAIKSVTEMYKNNSLDEKQVDLHYGSVVAKYGDSKAYKVEISYPQISGLKNEKIQTQINKEIKDQALSLYNEKVLKDKTIDRVFIDGYIESSFGDILSVHMYSNIYYKDENKDAASIDTALNFRLDTGEKIEFKDLFLNTAKLTNIISQYSYKALVWEKYYQWEKSNKSDDGEMDFTIDISKVDYSNFENELISIIQQYKRNGIDKFYFTPSEIYAYIGDLCITIPMRDCYQDIAIYKRFLSSNSLYKDNTIGRKNIFVFANEYNDKYAINGQLTDNFFADIYCGYSDDEYKLSDKVVDKLLDNSINPTKKKAVSNSKTAYILQGTIYYEYIEEKGIYKVNERKYLTTMSKDYYTASGMQELADKYTRGGKVSVDKEWYYPDEQDKNRTTIYDNKDYYIDSKGNVLDFYDIVDSDFKNMTKSTRKFEYNLPVVTESDISYTYTFDTQELVTDFTYTLNKDNIDTKNKRNIELSNVQEVDDWDKEIIQDSKQMVENFLDETLNIDIKSKLDKIILTKSEGDITSYLGGEYISIGNIGYVDGVREILKYIMTQANVNPDSIFVDENGNSQNEWLKDRLATTLAFYICGDYSKLEYNFSMNYIKTLLKIYGKDLLKDVFTGRNSVVEKDLKEICLNNNTYDAFVFSYDSFYILDGDISRYPFAICFYKLIKSKGYNIDVFNFYV